ncbi:uncharacterized protein LOC131996966 [Stomoxys calcitrans]|uniref:uncharacterized protein LOC131996966 n=1 Tax=Stomoxys calcitrans TaxID=35570 RepID=UPI0027E2FFBD|nr:uncharacterized protein LOC131996966 [Stomoxys calcitrans]
MNFLWMRVSGKATMRYCSSPKNGRGGEKPPTNIVYCSCFRCRMREVFPVVALSCSCIVFGIANYKPKATYTGSKERRVWNAQHSAVLEISSTILGRNCQIEVRKFYQRIKHQTDGFGAGTSSCRDKEGNLVSDTDKMLRICKEHFTQLLVSDDGGKEDTAEPIPDDGI